MIFLALGSNLSSSFGDRFKNIDQAISSLKDYGINLVKKSSYYETDSYPDKKKPKFINVVISAESNLSIEKLMSAILNIEKKLERERNKKNDPRTCDIDIIDYNNEVINLNYESFIIRVPHEKLTFRNFVLLPLREIDSKWQHPKTKENINDLIKKLSEEDKKSILMIEKS